MKSMRIRMLGLSIVAVFAIGAVTSAAASAALPEQVPAAGKFKVKSGKSAFETTSKEKITCKEDSGEGELTGAKTDKSKVSFSGCESTGVKCNSAGAKAGVIETEINSELVYLAKGGEATKTVGEDLVLAKEVSITCLIVKLKVKGSTLCPIGKINEKVKTLTITCAQKAGIQEYTQFVNNATGKVETDITETEKGGKWFQSGLESTETLELATEGEIKG